MTKDTVVDHQYSKVGSLRNPKWALVGACLSKLFESHASLVAYCKKQGIKARWVCVPRVIAKRAVYREYLLSGKAVKDPEILSPLERSMKYGLVQKGGVKCK